MDAQPQGYLKPRLLSDAQPQHFPLKQFCSLMFSSGMQSHSVGAQEREEGRERGHPALSAHSFQANAVLPFHPWLVRRRRAVGCLSAPGKCARRGVYSCKCKTSRCVLFIVNSVALLLITPCRRCRSRGRRAMSPRGERRKGERAKEMDPWEGREERSS